MDEVKARRRFGVLVFLFTFLALTPFAFADEVVPVTTDSNSLAQVKLSPLFVTTLIALVIPLVNGLLTKLSTSQTVKAVLTIVLTAISTFVTGLVMVDGSYVFSKESLFTWILTTVIAVGTYLGVYKPAGLTSGSVALPDPTTPGGVVHVPGKLANIGLS